MLRGVEASAGHAPGALAGAAAQMLHLSQCAWLADGVDAYHPLAFVRDKYASDAWRGASRAGGPAAAAAAAEALRLPADAAAHLAAQAAELRARAGAEAWQEEQAERLQAVADEYEQLQRQLGAQ